jgi:hypothetical protein
MANGLLSLKDFLQQRHLTHKNDTVQLRCARQRLEKSLLLETIRDICMEINAEAGTLIVDEHHYLSPEPIICSYIFKRDHTEYVMRVELCGPRPSLVFIARKWRDDSSNRLFRQVYRFASLAPVRVNIKFSCELPEESVSGEEIKRCFYYLLSGLSRTYIPSFPPCNRVRCRKIAAMTTDSKHSFRVGTRRVEWSEWWLSWSAIAIALLLSAGVASFALPLRHEDGDSIAMQLAVPGFLGMVLLVVLSIDVYAIYRRVQIHRIRYRLLEGTSFNIFLPQIGQDKVGDTPQKDPEEKRNHSAN